MLGRIWFLILLLSAPLATFAQNNSLKSPNVSANTLFLYRNSNFHQEDADETRNGVDLREAELMFSSDVDPYSRLSLLLSVHPNYKFNATSGKVEQTWAVEPEEVFAETDQIPGVTIKAGKFKAAFGKHNQLHTHAYPFIDAPLANSKLLGEEGLNDAGVSAAGLLPVAWFSEITAQYLRGAGENAEFSSPTSGDGVGVGHWKNLLDLSDALTMEIGASVAKGGNATGGSTSLYGGDLTFKWRPVTGGKYHSAIAAAEFIHRDMQQSGIADETGKGLALWGQFQFAERWASNVRYETLDVHNSVNPDLPNLLTTKECFGLTFNATEFSAFRLEYDMAHGPANAKGSNNEKTVYLQANFTIGAHPAHSY